MFRKPPFASCVPLFFGENRLANPGVLLLLYARVLRNLGHGPKILRALHGVEPHRGAVFQLSKSHGAARCVFFFLRIVRCGAVRFSLFQNHTVRCGAVRINFFKNRSVRCCAVRLSVEQLFLTVRLSVHRS